MYTLVHVVVPRLYASEAGLRSKASLVGFCEPRSKRLLECLRGSLGSCHMHPPRIPVTTVLQMNPVREAPRKLPIIWRNS